MIQLITRFKAFHSAILKTIFGVQEVNSPLIDRQNLTFNHSVDGKMSLEAIESKRFKDGGV